MASVVCCVLVLCEECESGGACMLLLERPLPAPTVLRVALLVAMATPMFLAGRTLLTARLSLSLSLPLFSSVLGCCCCCCCSMHG